MVTQALAYVERGWAVIPLRAAGMLPIERDWPGQARRTREGVEAAWRLYPDANLGVVTGRVSGFFALDIDPDNGGAAALAGLIQAYGRLPETYVVRTPSGGLHYYFLLPEDFEPQNAQHGRRSGRLPVGIDIRGWHGYVAAPPTLRAATTTKQGGSYTVETDFPLSPAPEWLIDMIRPVEVPERVERPASDWAPSVSASAAGSGLERGPAYARSAVGAVLGELANAPAGVRNETAFRVACRLVELINARWAGLDAAAVMEQYRAAGEVCGLADDRPAGQVEATWNAAVRQVGVKAAGLPDADFLGTAVDLGPFVLPGVDDYVALMPGPMFASPADGTESPANGPAEIIWPTAEQQMEALREQAVSAEMQKQWVRDEARLRLAKARLPTPPEIEILDPDEQLEIASPPLLVADWLAQGQLARVFGAPGQGKSFVAIDLAASISTGRAWHGREVAAGDVVYWAPEDAAGVVLRLRAWSLFHGVRHGVRVIRQGFVLVDEMADQLVGAIRRHYGPGRLPALVVVDTQAMATVGLDENDAGDMGRFVEAVKTVGRGTGAAVLVVHHAGVKGGRARGSSAILGAMDVEIESSAAAGVVTVRAVKQKNIALPAPLILRMRSVEMPDELDSMGRPVTSVVLLSDAEAAGDTDGLFASPLEPQRPVIEKRALAIAAVLLETQATGESYARVKTRAAEMADFGRTAGSVTANFSKAWAWLTERGRIAKAMGRESYYFVEVDGLTRLDKNPDKKVVGGYETWVPEVD